MTQCDIRGTCGDLPAKARNKTLVQLTRPERLKRLCVVDTQSCEYRVSRSQLAVEAQIELVYVIRLSDRTHEVLNFAR